MERMAATLRELIDGPALGIGLNAQSKPEVLEEMVQALADAAADLPREQTLQALKERESLSSTGIGEGIAIPHCRMRGLERTMFCLARSTAGVEYDSLDGQPVHWVFLFVAPESKSSDLLLLLARVSRVLKNQTCRRELEEAGSPEQSLERLLAYSG